MKEKLFACSEKLSYKVRRSRKARRLRLAVYCDGNVVVTVPWCLSYSQAHELVTEKADWIQEKIEYFKNKEAVLPQMSKKDFQMYKPLAYSIIRDRLDFFNLFYNFNYSKICIRDPKTRWASCSQNGNLSFSYKLLFLAEDMRDYVIVHELCHLKEFNHSARFWSLVEQTIPNYKDIRLRLRKM